jgi:glutamine amidotransferase
MLAQSSQEKMNSEDVQDIKCLGIINGQVKLMQVKNNPLPHMGWNQVFFKNDCPLFKDINNGSYFYFVHSYALEVTEHTIGICNYENDFSAIVNKDNFYGTQFHPEKSGKVGAKLLENFIKM